MRKEVRRKSEADIVKAFPIQGLVPGWYFRKREISNGAWEAAGTDLWGRMVTKQGDDPEALLEECVKWARNQGKNIA